MGAGPTEDTLHSWGLRKGDLVLLAGNLLPGLGHFLVIANLARLFRLLFEADLKSLKELKTRFSFPWSPVLPSRDFSRASTSARPSQPNVCAREETQTIRKPASLSSPQNLPSSCGLNIFVGVFCLFHL